MPLHFLSGFRVLDLSQYIPGPYAALMLADLGAEVVKVEPPGGDPMRQLGPRDADGISPLWKLMNGGKTVVEIDLKTPSGREALELLLGCADALVESYRPGVMDRLGFTRARLEELNPRLVHAALSGYGQTGPWRLRTGHDLNYMALAGGLAQSGPAEQPLMTAPPTADFASGLQAALTVCAALLGRARTGRGAYLDLSLAETVLAWQSPTLTAALRRGFEPERAANLLNGGAACYQVYRAADGRFVTLAAIEEKFWRNFCEAVGRPDLIARQWEKMPQQSLIADVAAVFATKDAEAWEATLGPVECCFGMVVEPRDVPTHPQIAARRMIRSDGSTIEALYPAHVDGQPPAPRPSVAIAPVVDVLVRWNAPGVTKGG
ncbi:MAG TPA: CoA transferase [Alphaproteobacteria bacterium]|nr:CoA transferase [Alphaproteobacteria bacterium]